MTVWRLSGPAHPCDVFQPGIPHVSVTQMFYCFVNASTSFDHIVIALWFSNCEIPYWKISWIVLNPVPQLSSLHAITLYCLLISLPGELQRIHSEFVQRVSTPVIEDLLDDLWTYGVLSTEEKEVMEEKRNKKEMAHCLIHMVISKRERASRIMIYCIKERDPDLYSTLGLISSIAGVGELWQWMYFLKKLTARFVFTRGELLCPLIQRSLTIF